MLEFTGPGISLPCVAVGYILSPETAGGHIVGPEEDPLPVEILEQKKMAVTFVYGGGIDPGRGQIFYNVDRFFEENRIELGPRL